MPFKKLKSLHVPLLSSQVEEEVDDIVMCVVQNKIDLIDEATMTP